MTENRSQPLKTWPWAILVLFSCAVGVLPYISWPAAGWTPRLQAFQPWMLIAALVAVLPASFRRQWIVAALIMAALVVGVLPNIASPWRQGTASGTSEVTVFSFNALKAGADTKQLARSIKDADPDVLVLVETSEPLHQHLAAEGALDSLGYRSAAVPTGGDADTAIFSRYPLTQQAHDLGPELTGWYELPVVEVHAPDGSFLVAGVHIYPPLGDASRWHSGLSALQQWADRHTDKPMILAGDYNSTRTHPQFRELSATMEPEASLLPITSWPADSFVPPMIGIDHVLSRELVPMNYEKFSIDGSDHQALSVTFSRPAQ